MRGAKSSVPSSGRWGIALVLFFVAVGLLILGAAIDAMPVIILGAIMVVAAGLMGMFYGEKAAVELSQGPEPGRGRRRR